MIEDLHGIPDPPPRPMNGYYLKGHGFSCENGVYVKDDIRITYDGAQWWVYYWCAMFRIETIEDFEKLVVL